MRATKETANMTENTPSVTAEDLFELEQQASLLMAKAAEVMAKMLHDLAAALGGSK
jgi:hypothetical protein